MTLPFNYRVPKRLKSYGLHLSRHLDKEATDSIQAYIKKPKPLLFLDCPGHAIEMEALSVGVFNSIDVPCKRYASLADFWLNCRMAEWTIEDEAYRAGEAILLVLTDIDEMEAAWQQRLLQQLVKRRLDHGHMTVLASRRPGPIFEKVFPDLIEYCIPPYCLWIKTQDEPCKS